MNRLAVTLREQQDAAAKLNAAIAPNLRILGMGNEWRVSTLKDAPLQIIDGDRGKNYPNQAELSTAGHCLFLNAGNVTNNGFKFSDCTFITAERDGLLHKGKLVRNDVVLTTRGTVGNAAYFDDSIPFDHIRINSGMVILRAQPPALLPEYLYFFVRSALFHAQVAALRTGSAQPQLPIQDINRVEIPIPPPDEQRAIAHILGTLDDKIELNRRMNETLEAMARALFKSWFVDFDPVRAKAEGRAPGLPQPLADLFPDSFGNSEPGEIPKGWRRSCLREVTAKIGSGATPRGGGSVYVADGVALIRSQNVYDSLFVWDGLARITDADADALNGVSVEREDVLLNITGVSILRTCIVDPDVLPARVNQHVCIIRPKPEIPARYIHFHLLQPSTKAFLMGMDAGASRQAVTKGHIESVPVVIPPKAVLDIFANLVSPLFATTSNNESESRSLASIRDALLPKLISGDLCVKDAERNLAMADL